MRSIRKRILKMGMLKLIAMHKGLLQITAATKDTLKDTYSAVQKETHVLAGYFTKGLCPNLEAFINHFRDIQRWIRERHLETAAMVPLFFKEPTSPAGVKWSILGTILASIWYGTNKVVGGRIDPVLCELIVRDRDSRFMLFPSSLAGGNAGIEVRALRHISEQEELNCLFYYSGELIPWAEGQRRARELNNQYIMDINNGTSEPEWCVDGQGVLWSAEDSNGTILLEKGRFLNTAVKNQAVHPQPQSFKITWRSLPKGTTVKDDAEVQNLRPSVQAVPDLGGKAIIIRALRPLWPYKTVFLEYNSPQSMEKHDAYKTAIKRRRHSVSSAVSFKSKRMRIK